MWRDLPLFPVQASTISADVDLLYLFLCAILVVFAGGIFATLAYFAIRYRRRHEDERPVAIHGNLAVEVVWTVIPLGIVLFIFGWASELYFTMNRAPIDPIEIYVVGKQWMWKLQHPQGRREINELHVPRGRAVKLIMTSEDVIHSFYVPVFRVKMDVLPDRYSSIWFEPTKTGEYHLFCAEYCGNKHSHMIGKVTVLDPVNYERWLMGGSGAGETMAGSGARLYEQLGCKTCHEGDRARCPPLSGLFGKTVQLEGGETVVADEGYLRESIIEPGARVVAGFQKIMPTYKGQVSEEGVNQLIEYVKSLSGQTGGTQQP